MANRYVVITTTSYQRNAIQTMGRRYHLKLVRMAIIKKSTTNAGEDVAKGNPPTMRKFKLDAANWGNSMEVPQNTQNRITIGSSKTVI